MLILLSCQEGIDSGCSSNKKRQPFWSAPFMRSSINVHTGLEEKGKRGKERRGEEGCADAACLGQLEVTVLNRWLKQDGFKPKRLTACS
eukprot:1014903-Pelagomonas_calceolata.AAC.1